MPEALEMVKVSKEIRQALLDKSGPFSQALDFMMQYENASWQEVSRQMVVAGIDENTIYNAYVDALRWFKELFEIRTR